MLQHPVYREGAQHHFIADHLADRRPVSDPVRFERRVVAATVAALSVVARVETFSWGAPGLRNNRGRRQPTRGMTRQRTPGRHVSAGRFRRFSSEHRCRVGRARRGVFRAMELALAQSTEADSDAFGLAMRSGFTSIQMVTVASSSATATVWVI